MSLVCGIGALMIVDVGYVRCWNMMDDAMKGGEACGLVIGVWNKAVDEKTPPTHDNSSCSRSDYPRTVSWTYRLRDRQRTGSLVASALRNAGM